MKYLKYFENKIDPNILTIDYIKNRFGEDIEFFWDILIPYEDDGLRIFLDIINPYLWIDVSNPCVGLVPSIFQMNNSIDPMKIDPRVLSLTKTSDFNESDFQFFITLEAMDRNRILIPDLFNPLVDCYLDFVNRSKVEYGDSIEFLPKSYLSRKSSRVTSSTEFIDISNIELSVGKNIYEIGINFKLKK
jgi:hypothetical protein